MSDNLLPPKANSGNSDGSPDGPMPSHLRKNKNSLSQPSTKTGKYCPKCDKINDVDQVFCQNCSFEFEVSASRPGPAEKNANSSSPQAEELLNLAERSATQLDNWNSISVQQEHVRTRKAQKQVAKQKSLLIVFGCIAVVFGLFLLFFWFVPVEFFKNNSESVFLKLMAIGSHLMLVVGIFFFAGAAFGFFSGDTEDQWVSQGILFGVPFGLFIALFGLWTETGWPQYINSRIVGNADEYRRQNDDRKGKDWDWKGTPGEYWWIQKKD